MVVYICGPVANVPGNGMAVVQVPYGVKELTELLEKQGAELIFGIRPVVGRMLGHVNVLLTEADCPTSNYSRWTTSTRG